MDDAALVRGREFERQQRSRRTGSTSMPSVAPRVSISAICCTAQFQYTTGVGVAGGALVDGWQGSLLKGWTITQSADDRQRMPVTPYYLTTTPGTGFTGAIRASLTGSLNRRTRRVLSQPGGLHDAGSRGMGRCGS